MMWRASWVAGRGQAEAALALTERWPEVALDVGEVVGDEGAYAYSLFGPEELKAEVAAELARLKVVPMWDEVAEDVDYVALMRAQFPPLQVGRWWVARQGEAAPAGLIGLNVAPNQAFGSGEHATTSGCLLALETLLQAGQRFPRVLDFGAGSGILALAAAKCADELGLVQPIVAVDNDPPSVAICAENAALNGVAERVRAEVGEVPLAGPFDLIFANVLLQPLVELAPKLVGALAPGGVLVLSGYLVTQAEELARVYEGLGLRSIWRREEKEWVAEVFQRTGETPRLA